MGCEAINLWLELIVLLMKVELLQKSLLKITGSQVHRYCGIYCLNN